MIHEVVKPNCASCPVGKIGSQCVLDGSKRDCKMARGQQKIQSQQKNAEKKAKQKKGSSQLKAADKALIYSCTVCLSKMPDPKTYKQHFESKHPKSPLPEVLQSV